MSFFNVVMRGVFAPTMDRIRGTHTMSCLRELEESQWWPAARLEELQSLRLRALITHAYEHVPYYRRVMDERGLTPSDIRSAVDLPKLPLLTKRAIRNAGETLLADNVRRSALRPMSTSGSTGEPLCFYSTVEDQFSRGMARSFRALKWAGISIGDRHATLSRPRHYARMREQFLNDLSLRVRRSVSLDYGSLTDADLASVVQQLSRGQFTSIGGSPPLLCLVANHVRFHGDSVPQVNAIVCGGEQLFPHERRLLRDTWGPEPHSKYSSFEIYDIAGECSAHSGLHTQWEDVVVEVLGEQGIPAPTGHAGALCLTSLHSRAMPFIRYDIGDIGAMDISPCACGRNLPRLVGVVGRTSELIVTRSGRRIFAADLDLESFAQLGVRQYRLVQEDISNVVAHIVWHSEVDPAVRANREQSLAATLGRSMGQEIVVTPKAVKQIEPTAAGKHMVVMSRLASRLSSAPSSGETE
jgi:phenylacetate-CoA ligase